MVAEAPALAIRTGLLQGAKEDSSHAAEDCCRISSLLARLHVLAELSKLILIKDPLCLLEHLAFFLLDVMLEVSSS
jgi:hypothetical protein